MKKVFITISHYSQENTCVRALYNKAASLRHLFIEHLRLVLNSIKTRKFYIRRNKNKVDSIEIGRIVIADLLH